MEFSANGQTILQRLEGFRAQPYKDQAGDWTIGYGCRITDPASYPNGITLAQGSELLLQRMQPVVSELNTVITVPVTQNQFDAICSFTYNVGGAAFRESTMLRLINDSQFSQAALEFAKWIYVNHNIDSGLQYRRAIEQTLFQEP